MTRFGDYIRRNNIEPSSAAEKLGVTMDCIYKWMAGERTPSKGQYPKIHAFTDGELTANDFFLHNEAAT